MNTSWARKPPPETSAVEISGPGDYGEQAILHTKEKSRLDVAVKCKKRNSNAHSVSKTRYAHRQEAAVIKHKDKIHGQH